MIETSGGVNSRIKKYMYFRGFLRYGGVRCEWKFHEDLTKLCRLELERLRDGS